MKHETILGRPLSLDLAFLDGRLFPAVPVPALAHVLPPAAKTLSAIAASPTANLV
jgi:hypothetical protein